MFVICFLTNGLYIQAALKVQQDGCYKENRDFWSYYLIGQGAFGECHLCQDITTEEYFVRKKVQRSCLIVFTTLNSILSLMNRL